MAILLFVVGLLFLVTGAEALVRGASRLAAALGLSPLVIGLTVVAFGTSSPELAISVKSVLSGQAGIAVGNVVGSPAADRRIDAGLGELPPPRVHRHRSHGVLAPNSPLPSAVVASAGEAATFPITAAASSGRHAPPPSSALP